MIDPQQERNQAESDLDEAIHALAQPLTALSFLAEMSIMQRDPETWRAALEAAVTETRRAMEQLRTVRDAAERITGKKGGGR
jgi:hypothetical protein